MRWPPTVICTRRSWTGSARTDCIHRPTRDIAEGRYARGMRFLHTADWQLGMTRHFLDADAQARFTAARMDVIGRIGA